MPSVKTEDYEDAVRQIAEQLRPWKCPRREVFAKVREAIDEVCEDLRNEVWLREVGTYTANKQYAQSMLVDVNRVLNRFDAAPTGFVANLPLVEEKGADKREENERKRREEWREHRRRLVKLAEQCKEAIRDPVGIIPNMNIRKSRTAFTALFLVDEVSTKRPNVDNEGNTSFCQIATKLFEVATGEHDI
jgi:hypothetical protein